MSESDPGALSEDEMFRAVYQDDQSYDGVFFFGVISTMIFCFPSCRSRQPRQEHVRFFPSREEALSQGFRPCKRCRPDLDGGRVRHEADLVAQVQILVGEHLDSINIERLAACVGLSPDYLMRLFRRVAGFSLHEFIRRQRALRAAELLRTSDQTILDIAAAVNFESASAFYSAFHRTMGVAPGEYRRCVTQEVSSHRSK